MQNAIEILLDVSGSMKDLYSSRQSKYQRAKKIIIEKFVPRLDFSASYIGLRTFGGECHVSNQALPLQKLSKSVLIDEIRSLPPPDGKTPIALAINNALDNLIKYPNYNKQIILITDGEETCGGDWAGAAQRAAELGIDCIIHTIGIFGEKDSIELRHKVEAQINEIAHITGGRMIIDTINETQNETENEIDTIFEPIFSSISINEIVNEFDKNPNHNFVELLEKHDSIGLFAENSIVKEAKGTYIIDGRNLATLPIYLTQCLLHLVKHQTIRPPSILVICKEWNDITEQLLTLQAKMYKDTTGVFDFQLKIPKFSIRKL